MVKRIDPSFPFYARDYLADEKVRVLSYEERGVLVELWCRAWSEGSIPTDLGRLAALLNITRQRVAKVWPRVSEFFEPREEGRAISPRQEAERKERLANREAMSEAGKAGNEKRWGRSPPDRDKRSPPDRGEAIAKHRSSSSSSSPSAVPHPHAPSQDGQPSVGAEPEPAAPAESGLEPSASDVAEQDALIEALEGIGFQNLVPPFKRRAIIRRWFVERELRAAHVQRLMNLARTKSTKEPIALIATWLERNTWREALDEQKRVTRERAPRPREDGPDPKPIGKSIPVEFAPRPTPNPDDVGPVYGEEPNQ